MRKWMLLILSLVLFALPAMAQDSADAVYLRAAHFSADAPEVDVYVNGELAIASFDFPDVSDWMSVEAGSFDVAVVPAGGSLEDAVVSDSFEFEAGEWATFAVIGEAARGELSIVALVDTLDEIPEGQTRLNVFHAIPETDPVNVFVNDVELVHGVGYPGTFEDSDGYVGNTILAGTYDIEIRDDAGTVLADAGEITLGLNRSYFLAAVGTRTNPQYVFVTTDIDSVTGNMAEEELVETGEGSLVARIGHFAVDAGEVDIYVDGSLVLAAASFGDLSDYTDFEAGYYDVALVPAGGSLDDAVYEGQIPLVADSVTLVAAIGYVEDGSVTVVAAAGNGEAPEFGNIRVNFFQAVPSLNLFDLSANGNTLVQGLAFPSAFEGAGDGYVSTDIVAGQYEFIISSGNTSLNVGTITTGAGRVYLIVAAGNEAAPVYFLFSGNFPE